ncbi:terpenoid cyclases/protein prenyltransferase alpha-alpha toroid [Sphaerosporella brunnea]|uniref:Geranylgeranyl transferase type-1 subunit beta n=1 Tax=Sphaerosporella brunnea TaxID=1250544 RepID=A0A5J5EXD0_9PEZI|nr:terpenoid cyclases/protein prenyltransferase alpha-alpha toroid [Sphaerosporella brunnea]
MSAPPRPVLDKPRHVRYWQRCLKTCLPEDYTSTDLNRMTLGCFSVAALDLLGELPFLTSPEDRHGWIEWVYRNQLPTGGFRGSPAADLGSASRWDPPNVSATFFAVATLVNLGDGLERLKRREILQLLPKLQREDGSFGECLLPATEDEPETLVGTTDMRFVYMAVALRWMLRGQAGMGCPDIPDFDVDKTVAYIRSSQSYDGGISEKPFGESHAGMTYCAIAALSLLGRLDASGLQSVDSLTKWLVHRQVPFEEKDGMDEDDWQEILETGTEEEKEAAMRVERGADGRPIWGGFHGRCNKKADTCYSFWVGASLEILKKLYLIDVNANRRFLLEKTKHVIGGFMKLPQPGGFPDILHSFLGLAALGLMREEGINRLDAALCMSMQAKERLMALDWWAEGRSQI